MQRVLPITSLVLAALLVAVPARHASAQFSRVGLSNPERTQSRGVAVTDTVPRGHWKTGMLVGAGVGVVLGGLTYEFAEHISDNPDSVNPAGILLIAGLCSLLGGLIGSMFH